MATFFFMEHMTCAVLSAAWCLHGPTRTHVHKNLFAQVIPCPAREITREKGPSCSQMFMLVCRQMGNSVVQNIGT